MNSRNGWEYVGRISSPEIGRITTPVTGKFQQRVLDKACEDINTNTDMHISYQALKSGKRTTSYEFCIRYVPTQQEHSLRGSKDPRGYTHRV